MATVSRYASIKLKATVSATADPTGASVYFALLDPDSDTDPTDNGSGGDDWVEGEWGTWSTSALQADAITPTRPATGAGIAKPTPDTYRCWIKFSVGGETFVEQFDTVVVT